MKTTMFRKFRAMLAALIMPSHDIVNSEIVGSVRRFKVNHYSRNKFSSFKDYDKLVLDTVDELIKKGNVIYSIERSGKKHNKHFTHTTILYLSKKYLK